MATGKPLRNDNYTTGRAPKHIEMPPLPDETPTQESPTQETQIQENSSQENSSQENSSQENSSPDTNFEDKIDSIAEDTNHESTTYEAPTQESDDDDDDEQEVTSSSNNSRASGAKDSFKAIREAKKKAEYERDMLLKQVLEYQQYQKQQAAPKQEEPKIDDDINFDIDEDGLVEGRYVKKVTNRIKNLEKQLSNYEAQSKQQSIESRIKSEMPDFDKVVSTDSISMLNKQFPQIAETLKNTSDLYSKAVSAYSIIKKFGIYREDAYAPERVKALRNTQKPKPVVSVSSQQGDSPLAKANIFADGLTEELKAQLRREMNEATRNF